MAERILVVDDDPETLRLIGLVLQRQGYEIISADDGPKAIDLALNERPNLIVLDVMLPDLDGFQVAKRLRENPATVRIPILMFSAKSQVSDKAAGFEAGVDDYLTKPIHPVELVARIKSLLERYQNQFDHLNERGYTIAVMAAKGGLGTSIFLLNLAIEIYRKSQKTILGAELRPGHGTWAIELGYPEPEGLNKILSMKPAEIISTAIDSEIVHTPHGVDLLMASSNIKDVSLVANTTQMELLVKELPSLATMVMLDIGASMLPGLSAILESCQEILFLTEPTPTAIQKTRQTMRNILDLGFSTQKPLSTIVVNRARADVELTLPQMQQALEKEVIHVISPAPEASFKASATHVPMIKSQPDGIVAQQYGQLAEMLIKRIF